MKKILVCIVMTVLGVSVLSAQDSIPEPKTVEYYSDYKFKVSPFFWFLGLKGEIIAPPQPSTLPEPPPRYQVDLSFSDLSSSIRFITMMGMDYKGEHFIIRANVTSLILEGQAITPLQIITEGVDYRFTYLTSEITGGYRILKNPKLDLDVLLGVRMLYTKITGETDIVGVTFTGERQVFWWDPILGFQIKYRPHERLELTGYTDFGPIRNVDSYQFQAQAIYHLTKTFSMALGYRNYYINSEAEEKETIYKGRVYGPFARLGFQF
ncbi:DUF481 domain-containing protein [Winogradskyella aurantiaca]|uniref:DUF481 domain-containing protein n=1 Tax=Winogradskyella aurantiaca TaxID=2219558 RepID=UPI000E1DFCFF|nr:DUF481 domain-containing protein [Winogradskyella aurantiaca]